jgi:hypothetical protein
MRPTFLRCSAFSRIIAVGVIAAVYQTGGTASAQMLAGASVRDITPDPLLPVSGGMGIPKAAREKRGELTKCLSQLSRSICSAFHRCWAIGCGRE